MDKYIKREDALNIIHRFRGYIDEDMEYRMKLAINKIPPADVVEVRHGKLEEGCSVCGSWNLFDFDGYNCESNFCPNCGADMRGGT